jgi:hypothetical protein
MRTIPLTAVAALSLWVGTATPAQAQYYYPNGVAYYAGPTVGFSPYAITPSYGYNFFSPYGYNPNVYFSVGPRYYNYGYYPGYMAQYNQWTWTSPTFSPNGPWRWYRP